MEDIRHLGVRWIVFSGGEPLMHSDLFRLASLIRTNNIRVTILTTGLLLERNAQAVVDSVDDVIVSLDGPEEVHDQIRRVPGAFRRVASGIQALHRLDPSFPVSARSTVQRLNHNRLRETALTARTLGCRTISFLPVDMTSEAFNRGESWSGLAQEQLALSEPEIATLEQSAAELLAEWSGSGFIAEDAPKFARMVLHFRSHLGLAEPI